MSNELNIYAQAKESRRRSMAGIPEAFFNPLLQGIGSLTAQKEKKLDRLETAKMLRERIAHESTLRDAAIRVKTQEAQAATIAYKAGRDGTSPEEAIVKVGGPELFSVQDYQRGLDEKQQIDATSEENAAFQEVGALTDIDAVQKYQPKTPAQAKARSGKLSELVDAGELKKKQEKEKKNEDVSKSITAAGSLEELDRIDTGGDSPLNTSLMRRRKVLAEDQSRRLGEGLSGYKGDIEGLDAHFKEKGFKPTPGELAQAQDIVFKRKSYERIAKDIEIGDQKVKEGKVGEAASLYTRSANALNAQVDDMEKKAIVETRDIVTGAITRTFDLSKLTPAEQTELTRLKRDRIKAVDALTTLSSGGPQALLGSMSPEQKRAMAEALLKEMEPGPK